MQHRVHRAKKRKGGAAKCPKPCYFEWLELRLLLSSGPLSPNSTAPFTTANTLEVIANPQSLIQPDANYTAAFGYTPAQLRTGYGFGDLSNPGFTNRGDGQTIAVVLWNDTPTITADLTKYSADFGLPAPTSTSFQVVFASGTRPATADQPTMTEADGDVETLHAIAPDANIILVEAATNSTSDVYSAIDTAAQLVANAGGGVVNMSFSVSEYPGVTTLENHFTTANPDISFIAATGDSPGELSFPATSPLVTAVGGTTLKLDSSGNRISESAWSSGGGGASNYFSLPSFQNNVTINGASIGTTRATPDVALAADPGTGANPTGLALYHSWTDSNGNTGYDLEFAGTSLATPIFSGLVTMADQLRVADGNSVLGSGLNQALYNIAATIESTAFNDITTGNNTYQAYPGYDLATGWGSPKASSLIGLLAGGIASDQPPVIGSLTTSPGSQGLGVGFALNANSVADPDGTVSNVSFYRESNSTPGLQTTGSNTDTLLGTGSLNGTTWSLTVSTTGLGAGIFSYYALATDNLGVTSATGASALSITDTIVGAAPTLAAAADSGVSSTDGITNFNNSSPAKALQFTISNTLPNATESVYINGTLYGSATASGTTTVVTTNGNTPLPDGTYTVTYRQTPIFKSQSGDSAAATITILTAIPAAPPAPVLEAASDTGISNSDGVTNDNTPTLDVSAAPYFRIYANGTQTGGSYQTGTASTLPAQADGSYAYTATAVDIAGNESAPSPALNVIIDTTAPAIFVSRITPANANGWNNTSVTISYAAGDSLSGLDANSPNSGSFTFTSQGAGQSHTFTVTDIAGNSASASVNGVNIDLTAPTLTDNVNIAPAATGWYNLVTGAPTITFSAGDSLSGGVSAPAPVTLGNGANQTVTQTVTDLAGNSTTINITGLNVDLTPPTITAQRDTTANTNGWNNTSVSASFTAADAISGLASAAGGSFVFSSEGANQSHTFTATDVAGNSASASITGVNIDETAPTLTASANTAPAPSGWYNMSTGAPTITFIAADSLSGVTTPPPVLLTDGANQSVTRTVTDLAGNSASFTVTGIYVDLTPPTITAQRNTPANANGWNNTSVSVGYAAGDSLSGLSSPATGAFTFTAEGTNQSHTFTVTDVAGNTASATVTGINIDETPPLLTQSTVPAPASTGWYNIATGAPTITYTASDALSGGVTAPAPVVVGQGTNQTISRTVTDLAGNSTTVSTFGLNVDLIPPTISAQRITSANANGWNNTSVAISYTASDANSGLAADSPATGTFTFTTQGAAQSHTFTVTDVAGNSASATVAAVNIDETPPTITASVSGPPASTGWYNIATGAPTITFTASDALSGGVTAPAPVVVGQGANQTISRTVTDLAGNSTTVSTFGLNVDLIPPTISAQRITSTNVNGWNNTSVAISYTASDANSGLAADSPATGTFTFTDQGAAQSHTFTVTDVAGNSASATTAAVNIDETPPTITASVSGPPASTGWYNIATGAPTITFTASDALSGGVASPAAVTLTDGANQTVTRTVTDLAGNSATATITGLNVDTTPPVIVPSTGAAPNAQGDYDVGLVIGYQASDPISGLVSPSTGSYTFTTQGNNQSHTFTVTDVAGNTTTSTVGGINIVGSANERYVSQLYLDLLHRPVDATGLSTWVGDLNNGATFQDVAMAITSSREYDADIVDGFYVTYLGRHAETYGLNAWVDQMQSGLNAEVILAGILGSDEYYKDVGGTNTAFITALYEKFLGRAPETTPSGLPYWLNVLQTDVAGGMTVGQARQAVSAAISNSNENRIDVVTSYYETFLHRAPDPAGLDAWVQNLANGVSQPTIVSAFVTSPEYLALNGIS